MVNYLDLESCTLPSKPGVGFKSQHFQEIIEHPGDVSWFEIHAENYMGDGGRPIAQLKKLRENFPISCHGVGLSIGGEDPLDIDHLNRLQNLVSWLEPAVFSEHLAWSTHEGSYFNDLLPLPYNDTTLECVSEHIDQVQETLQRPMLLENPSNYLEFEESTHSEIEFIEKIAKRTGCFLLLDVNNVYVSSENRNFDPYGYLDDYPLNLVKEIHLGGHELEQMEGGPDLLIDNHASEVIDPVWTLYEYLISKTGPLPTLIEWDNDIPDWEKLSSEATKANCILSELSSKAA
ncbi:MAG: DUF692 domain-containing protein [Rhodobacteraceae bacterium]|nr:DUF692 domain-containing protein [Paracoccaceae bacterium]